jgi:hypothetical protein
MSGKKKSPGQGRSPKSRRSSNSPADSAVSPKHAAVAGRAVARREELAARSRARDEAVASGQKNPRESAAMASVEFAVAEATVRLRALMDAEDRTAAEERAGAAGRRAESVRVAKELEANMAAAARKSGALLSSPSSPMVALFHRTLHTPAMRVDTDVAVPWRFPLDPSCGRTTTAGLPASMHGPSVDHSRFFGCSPTATSAGANT